MFVVVNICAFHFRALPAPKRYFYNKHSSKWRTLCNTDRHTQVRWQEVFEFLVFISTKTGIANLTCYKQKSWNHINFASIFEKKIIFWKGCEHSKLSFVQCSAWGSKRWTLSKLFTSNCYSFRVISGPTQKRFCNMHLSILKLLNKQLSNSWDEATAASLHLQLRVDVMNCTFPFTIVSVKKNCD